MSKTVYIDRPPRIRHEFPMWEEALPDPPAQETSFHFALVQVARPLLMTLVYGIASLLGQSDPNRLWYLLPTGLLAIVSIFMSWRNIQQHERQQAQKKALYLENLTSNRQKLEVAHAQQARYYWHEYPEPEKTIAIASDAQHVYAHDLPHTPLSSRLWAVRPADADFPSLRLGVGAQRSSTRFLAPQNGDSTDPLVREAYRLAEDSSLVAGVPLVVSLRSAPRHAIGVVGKPELLYPYIQALLVSYTGSYAPTDTTLFVLGSDQARQHWRWAFALPHCKTAQQSATLCFEDEQDRQTMDANKATHFLKSLRRTLDGRLLRLKDSNQTNVTLPFLLVILDLLTLPPDASLLKELETDPAISILLHDGDSIGAAVIFLVPEQEKVPAGCGAVIEVEALTNAQSIQGNNYGVTFRYAETGINPPRLSGYAELVRKQETAQAYARLLEPLAVRQSYGANLPNSVGLLELLKVKNMAELGELIRHNWRINESPQYADWIKAPIGVLTGGEVRWIKFSADADGLHSMLAGTTGSGKSVLLNSEILSLAIQYPPSILNFLLIDFKGGGAFEAFRKLPHCLDVVTNLTEAEVDRVFASITAELERRQALNAPLGPDGDIVLYRKQGLHVPPYGRTIQIREKTYQTAPYPHLFVIIDEFAELIALKPEYKAQLDKITRLGRALGVTLILAAQRPSGVTDQMRANIKLRICLRVESPEESAEVLRLRDAYYLPDIPGRGYLQRGNENLEMMQVAYASGVYSEVEEVSPDVIFLDRERKPTAVQHQLPRLYEVIIDLLGELAQEQGLTPRKPWPDFLPEKLSLSTVLNTRMEPERIRFLSTQGKGATQGEEQRGAVRPVHVQTRVKGHEPASSDGQWVALALNPLIKQWQTESGIWPDVNWHTHAMRAVVGVVDNPYRAVQAPLELNFTKDHVVIFSASGWGKTTFLQTVMVTLATTHSPQALHIYVLDFGGRTFSLFEKMPHVGAIITPDEAERVQRLLRWLVDTLDRRKQIMSEAATRDLYEYNVKYPQHHLPAILVVIDNFAEMKGTYEPLLPTLNVLLRESRAYGIHFILSAERPATLGTLYSLMTERLTFKQSDTTEYSAIVGRVTGSLEELEGRGLVRREKRALQFQAALPAGTKDADYKDEREQLQRMVKMMDRKWTRQAGERPATIEILPTQVLLRALLTERTPSQQLSGNVQPFIGIGDWNLKPWAFDLRQAAPHLIVVGPPGAGKTTTLRTLTLSLAYNYTPDQVNLVLVDIQRQFTRYGGRYTLDDLPHTVESVTQYEQLALLTKNLTEEFAEPSLPTAHQTRKAIFVMIDNYEAFIEEIDAEEKRQEKTLTALARLAREYGTSGLHFVIAGGPGILRSGDKLRKQIIQAKFGLCLQTAEPVSDFNGKPSHSIGELPLGRGYIVKSGQVSLLQVATPYEDDHIEPSLDRWITDVQERYRDQQAEWSCKLEKNDHPPLETTSTRDEGIRQPPFSSNAPVDAEQQAKVIEWLKRALMEKGVPASLVSTFDLNDLKRIAIEVGIIEDLKRVAIQGRRTSEQKQEVSR